MDIDSTTVVISVDEANSPRRTIVYGSNKNSYITV